MAYVHFDIGAAVEKMLEENAFATEKALASAQSEEERLFMTAQGRVFTAMVQLRAERMRLRNDGFDHRTIMAAIAYQLGVCAAECAFTLGQSGSDPNLILANLFEGMQAMTTENSTKFQAQAGGHA